MKESAFYQIVDATESINTNFCNGYFPTVEELEFHNVKNNPDRYLPLISFFANNPYKEEKYDEETTQEYKAMVKYCNDIISQVELEDDDEDDTEDEF